MRLPALSRSVPLLMVLAISPGCHEWFIDRADRQVYRLIEQRQAAALGETHDARLGEESGDIGPSPDKYSFVPHPVDPTVPEIFRQTPTTQPTERSQNAETQSTANNASYPSYSSYGAETTATQPATASPSALSEEARQPFTLADSLAYAQKHSREYQSAKEDLYLAGLELTLERHLWTPQFVSTVSTEFADYGQIRDFDRAMTAVAEVSATQALPYGGEVAARVVHSLMRDLGVHTTSGETGQMILEANLPLLRGAGRVAYESRYQAERNLIYAVRDFETFRRSFLVSIASDFFNLLVSKAAIENAEASVVSFAVDVERSNALVEADRAVQVDAGSARVQYLIAQNQAAQARESYESDLDLFKIRLGMPAETPLDAVATEQELYDPQVPEKAAIETALRYRLDLVNTLDAVDDARRQVLVAKNHLLPQFNIDGSVTLDSNAVELNSASYNTERTTWRGMATLEVPLDRVEERNAYRSSIIDLRRSERTHDEAADRVRVDVRRTLRGIEQARFSMDIQQENIRINEVKREIANVQYELGILRSNRDKLDAENDLRDARNDYAQEVSNYRRAILEFLRDTGTLRVGEDGLWLPLSGTNGEGP